MSRRTTLARRALNQTRTKTWIRVPGQLYSVYSYTGPADPARILAPNMRPETIARIHALAKKHYPERS